MAVLSSQGADALTIDRLAEGLGVTKGSFYHHFKNQADYRAALLKYWEQGGMAQMVDLPETADGAWAILDRVADSTLVGTGRNDPGMAIRFWATRDRSVHSFVERVDGERLAYFEGLLSVTLPDRERARFFSRLLYALALGSGHVLPPVEHETPLGFYREFKRLIAEDLASAL